MHWHTYLLRVHRQNTVPSHHLPYSQTSICSKSERTWCSRTRAHLKEYARGSSFRLSGCENMTHQFRLSGDLHALWHYRTTARDTTNTLGYQHNALPTNLHTINSRCVSRLRRHIHIGENHPRRHLTPQPQPASIRTSRHKAASPDQRPAIHSNLHRVSCTNHSTTEWNSHEGQSPRASGGQLGLTLSVWACSSRTVNASRVHRSAMRWAALAERAQLKARPYKDR
jgi:hypothetical protein